MTQAEKSQHQLDTIKLLDGAIVLYKRADLKSKASWQCRLELGDGILDEFPAAIRAKIVQKCGSRTYWETWAKDIGDIAKAHIARIKAALEAGDNERAVFEEFLAEIRDDLNGSVTRDEAIEMLAQHLVTKPVFDALFEGYDFAAHNPVSQAMQNVLVVLEPQNIQKEAASLESFYDSVKRRAKGIDNAAGKQKIIVEL